MVFAAVRLPAFLREAGSLGAAHPPPLLWPERALDELRGTERT